ncbi:hypothetical protein E2I00_013218, partial [Balaenoptera physalus]
SDALTRVVSGPGFCIQPQHSLPVAGVPVSSRVSSKIQQLLNTLKKPKRPPLKEFFVDDFEELLEVQQPEPSQPKPEGGQMAVLEGELLAVGSAWPPSLLAALQQWGTTQPKAPCLTALDTTGKAVYTLTYGKCQQKAAGRWLAFILVDGRYLIVRMRHGQRLSSAVGPAVHLSHNVVPEFRLFTAKGVWLPHGCPGGGRVKDGSVFLRCCTTQGKLWSRSLKLAYTLLNKLTNKNEPLLKPGDRVALVFPNSDPVMFTVAFYGCLLAELVPVPIEVPLTRKVASAYKTSKEGSTVGVAVSHASLLAQCQALTQACGYSEGRAARLLGDSALLDGWSVDTGVTERETHSLPIAETLTNVLDFKRDAGLWHGVLTSVMNRMHVVSIPYALMKANPLSWVQKVCAYQGSISSCDAFLNVFQARGLRPEVICPCASSPEALTVAIRRPPQVCPSAHLPARVVHAALSAILGHGVIRLDAEEKLSVLAVQDVGQAMPGGEVAAGDGLVLRPGGSKGSGAREHRGASDDPPREHTRDPVQGHGGELRAEPGPGGPVALGQARGSLGMTHLGVLLVRALEGCFLSLANVCVVKVEGIPYLCKTDEVGEICVNSSATATAYYGLLGITKNIFETVPVTAGGAPISDRPFTRTGLLGFIGPDNLVFVVGKLDGLMVERHKEQDDICSEEARAGVLTVHRARGSLEAEIQTSTWARRPGPDATRGTVHVVLSLLKLGIAVFSVTVLHDDRIVLVAEQRPDASEEDSFQWMSRVLQAIDSIHQVGVYCLALVPANTLPKAPLGGIHVSETKQRFLEGMLHPCNVLMCPHTCVTNLPKPRQKQPGKDPAGLPSARAHPALPSRVSKSACVLTTQAITRLLKSKEALAAVDVRTWPTILDTDDIPKKKVASIFRPPSPDVLAYLDFSVSTTGILAGVKMSHAATSALCRSIKLQCELYPSRQIAICLDPYCGLGFALWCLCSVYSGHQSVLVPPPELEANASLWLWAVSQYKARVTFCSYSVMETCARGLGAQTAVLRLFRDLGLPARAVSTTFGCRVNVAICLQGTFGGTGFSAQSAIDRILPGVKVIIAHTETRGPLGDSHLGEVRLQSPAHPRSRSVPSSPFCPRFGSSEPWGRTATGYYTVYGEEGLHADHFSARLSFGDTQTVWARTGFLGFLRRTELTDASGERHDALYVVGSLDEALELRGMRYHPVDIETSVIRAHRSVAECAVFTWTNLLVVVVELDGLEQDALDLVALVTNAVLEEHLLVVGVVVIVDPGVIPINSRGEKQRMHLRDGFLADQLDPIYVAYNM